MGWNIHDFLGSSPYTAGGGAIPYPMLCQRLRIRFPWCFPPRPFPCPPLAILVGLVLVLVLGPHNNPMPPYLDRVDLHPPLPEDINQPVNLGILVFGRGPSRLVFGRNQRRLEPFRAFWTQVSMSQVKRRAKRVSETVVMVRLHALTGLRDALVAHQLEQQGLSTDATASIGVTMAGASARCVARDAKLARKKGRTRCSAVLGDGFAFQVSSGLLKRAHGGGRCITLTVKLRPGGMELGKVIVDLHGLVQMGWHKGEFVDYALGTSTAKLGVSVYMKPVSKKHPWSQADVDRLVPPKFKRPDEDEDRKKKEEADESESEEEGKAQPERIFTGAALEDESAAQPLPGWKFQRCQSAPGKLQAPHRSALLSQQAYGRSKGNKLKSVEENKSTAEGHGGETVDWIQLPPGTEGDGLSSSLDEMTDDEVALFPQRNSSFLDSDVKIYAKPQRSPEEDAPQGSPVEKEDSEVAQPLSPPSVTYSAIKKIVDRVWHGAEDETQGSNEGDCEMSWSSNALQEDFAQKAQKRAATREKLALLVAETAQQVEEQLHLHRTP